jgi:hypothetical protein
MIDLEHLAKPGLELARASQSYTTAERNQEVGGILYSTTFF